MPPSSWEPTRGHIVCFLIFWLVLAVVSLFSGPALGDHEVIVAQIARQIVESGDWLVLRYLDTPFLVKPPLAPWLVAGLSKVLPPDPMTGHTVSAISSRVPSMIATFGTILLVHALGRSMYGRRIGAISAFVFATSFGALLYAFNATAEAVLTFFCTWAFAEFWWANATMIRNRRRWHLFRFYVALGLSMLAKGPMPLAIVCVPIAVWWWCHRAGNVAVHGGIRGIGRGVNRLVRDLWPRLRQALGSLGLWWGIPLFLLLFLPWMWMVGRRESHFWELWEYEYLDRFEGRYPGSREGNSFYYIPIALGFALPWALSVPHAIIAPALREFRPLRKPLSYAWYWVVVSVVVMSAMSFKKPYYILPATPALALLLAPVLDRLFVTGRIRVRMARVAAWTAVGIFAIGAVVCWILGGRMYPEEWTPFVRFASMAGGAGFCLAFAWAAKLFVANQRPRSLAVVGYTGLIGFTLAWHWIGPAAANIESPTKIVKGLADAGVPNDAEFYWAANRPDGRVLFYGDRTIRQVVDPYKLIVEKREHVTDTAELREMVGNEICSILAKPTPVYIVLEREDFITLVKLLKADATELFYVDRGKVGPDKDDWVVSTNAAGIAKTKKPVKAM